MEFKLRKKLPERYANVELWQIAGHCRLYTLSGLDLVASYTLARFTFSAESLKTGERRTLRGTLT